MEKFCQPSNSVSLLQRWKIISFIFFFSTLYVGLQAQIYGPGAYSTNVVVGADQSATVTAQGWAGGGGGGNGTPRQSGGGGGAYFTNTYVLGPGTYAISGNVGSGGPQGGTGGTTTFTLSGPGISTTITLLGGGAGANATVGSGGTGSVTGGAFGATIVNGAPGGTRGTDTGGGGGGSGLVVTAGGAGGATAGGTAGTPNGGAGGGDGQSGQPASGVGGGGGGKGKDGTSSGTGGAGRISLEIVLPVELSRFEAKPKNDMVELLWTTSSELNNDFFQVEHSTDGITFTGLGKIKGNGTTNETVNYEFMHRKPITGINYYRLKQVDFDGAFEYSPMVVVNIADRTGGINIFPNPTVDRAVVTLGERPENVKFTFTNILGQGIDLQPVSTATGWEIDLSRLGNGIYVLRAEYEGKVVTRQIVKN
jgi:hypothetical protein